MDENFPREIKVVNGQMRFRDFFSIEPNYTFFYVKAKLSKLKKNYCVFTNFVFLPFQFPMRPILDQKLDTNPSPQIHEPFATNEPGKFGSTKSSK